MNAIWGVVREGRIEPLEDVELAEGAKVLVILSPDDEDKGFWLAASQSALNKIWDNEEDDVYAELLKT